MTQEQEINVVKNLGETIGYGKTQVKCMITL